MSGSVASSSAGRRPTTVARILAPLRRVYATSVRSIAFDLCVSGAIVLTALLTYFLPDRLGGVVGLLMAVALVVRRRWPVQVFAVVCALGLVQVVATHRVWAFDVAVALAMYSVVKYADRMAWAWGAAGAMVAGATLHGLLADDAPINNPWCLRAAMLLILAAPIWLVGLVMRTRRLYVRSLEARAIGAEQERDQRARLAVADERGRIARELHDVVAHGLAVMIVQADGASYAIDDDPATAKNAVRTVADTGREALSDMHRLVAVLRGTSGQDAGAEPGEGERRQVGLARLDELLARFRAAGLRIEESSSGEVRALPGGVELAGYRIVQEALTNVLKHAGAGSAVTLSVTYQRDRVEVEVLDDGAGRNRFAVGELPGGHGLLGMRERVAVYDGVFEAGPRVGPGWRVAAALPVPSPDYAIEEFEDAARGADGRAANGTVGATVTGERE